MIYLKIETLSWNKKRISIKLHPDDESQYPNESIAPISLQFFSIANQIRWKFRSTFTLILKQWQLQFWCMVRRLCYYFAIWWPENKLQKGKDSIKLRAKIVNDTAAYGAANSFSPSAAYMRQWIGPALFQIIAWRLLGAKPLFKPMMGYYQF